jgi:hypothetical protein
MGALLPSPLFKLFDRSAFIRRERVCISRQGDQATERFGIDKGTGSLEKVLRLSYSWHEELFGQTPAKLTFDENIVRACDRPTMDAE